MGVEEHSLNLRPLCMGGVVEIETETRRFVIDKYNIKFDIVVLSD